MPRKVRDIIKLIEDDGWVQVRQRGTASTSTQPSVAW